MTNIDAILSIRDQIGAVKKPVYLVQRSWFTDGTFTALSGEIGNGVAQDVEVQLLPSPQLVDYTQAVNIREGGSIKGGDIILKMISKSSWSEVDLDGSSSDPSIEKLYRVGARIYQVISVTEGYVTWNVQLRELSNQARY